MSRIFLSIVVASLSAACNSKPTGVACVPELSHALDITVIDSITGAVVPQATIVVTDGTGWYDSADVVMPKEFFAGHSPGTYTIVTRAAGYASWTQSVQVPVASDVNGCVVPATVFVRARLQRSL